MKLNGNKTYATALLLILHGIYMLLTGDAGSWDAPQAGGGETEVLLGGGLASIRHAIGKLGA